MRIYILYHIFSIRQFAFGIVFKNKEYYSIELLLFPVYFFIWSSLLLINVPSTVSCHTGHCVGGIRWLSSPVVPGRYTIRVVI